MVCAPLVGPILVLAGIELTSFLVASAVLCFGSDVRAVLLAHMFLVVAGVCLY